MSKITRAENQRITIAYNLDAGISKLKTLNDAGVALTEEHLSVLNELAEYSAWMLATSIGAVTEPLSDMNEVEGDADDVREGPVT